MKRPQRGLAILGRPVSNRVSPNRKCCAIRSMAVAASMPPKAIPAPGQRESEGASKVREEVLPSPSEPFKWAARFTFSVAEAHGDEIEGFELVGADCGQEFLSFVWRRARFSGSADPRGCRYPRK